MIYLSYSHWFPPIQLNISLKDNHKILLELRSQIPNQRNARQNLLRQIFRERPLLILTILNYVHSHALPTFTGFDSSKLSRDPPMVLIQDPEQLKYWVFHRERECSMPLPFATWVKVGGRFRNIEEYRIAKWVPMSMAEWGAQPPWRALEVNKSVPILSKSICWSRKESLSFANSS